MSPSILGRPGSTPGLVNTFPCAARRPLALPLDLAVCTLLPVPLLPPHPLGDVPHVVSHRLSAAQAVGGGAGTSALAGMAYDAPQMRASSGPKEGARWHANYKNKGSGRGSAPLLERALPVCVEPSLSTSTSLSSFSQSLLCLSACPTPRLPRSMYLCRFGFSGDAPW